MEKQQPSPSNSTVHTAYGSHRWFDIGANLTHNSFANDRQKVLQRAHAKGVGAITITGTDINSSRSALELVHTHNNQTPEYKAQCPRLFSTAGVHPHHAEDWTPTKRDTLLELLEEEPVVAVGETGLDYFRNFAAKDSQLRCFAAQLRIAADLKAPVFVHSRDAHRDLHARLKEWAGESIPFVVHCFTGSESELDELIELGAYIGITGWICDERRGLHLQKIVSKIPLSRLIVETDAPYLLPRDLKLKDRRNVPEHLAHIGQTIAKCRGEDPELIATNTWQNAHRLFGIPLPNFSS